ncbi:glycerate kinase [Zhihengliuella salsuginis]|uniref:Glycerate kinase n=1 Tax=Zhihengliuella salsuginis TaxID=578222 RepID=A0ABQ3GNI5_9MICC|nr:glycerate kinase [Zhihengliuella salsuginis]GHD12469.1 glycerate kinase [Zhihengliuella salsuginis]
MKVVVAPDKFKGSLTGAQAADAIAAGVRDVLADAEIVEVPVADGGEGTVAAAVAAGFELRTAAVAGPTGADHQAAFALRGSTAVVELASASGLDALPGGPDPLGATSRGTGDAIRAALDAGAREIVLGLGGSASTDGGAGLLVGLGARLLDESGAGLPDGGASLARLACVDLSGLDPRLVTTRFTLAADVDNPLLGVRGAAAVFGPQKGATPAQVSQLDAALARFVEVLDRVAGADCSGLAGQPGAGAAGGVGFAALALLGARRRSGFQVVAELVGLDAALAGADAAITGEGSLDEQTLGGKTPAGVAAAATDAGVPAHAVCGRSLLDDGARAAAGFASVVALTDYEPDPAVCMRDAAGLARRAGREIAQHLAERPAGGGGTIGSPRRAKELTP